MDNHPIPQDVTGFQFKLIGNLTVKQFAYLATGIVFAWILLQLPINILIKFPLGVFSAIFGAGLAYFPVSGRPMDLMIGNYIKALFRPTQFVYGKVGGQIYFPNKTPLAITKNVKQYKNYFTPFPKDKLKAYLESLDAKPKNKADEKENNFLMSVSSLTAGNISHQATGAPDANTPQAVLQVNPISHNEPAQYRDNLSPTSAVPQAIAATQSVRSAMPPLVKPDAPQYTSPIGMIAKTEPDFERQAKAAKPMPRGFNKTAGTLSIPDSPNLITGITKDARGNALSNILIEVRDKDNNPVRAFKTNELGRFASSTPLASGTYTVEFEDSKAQNKFEKITINATGQIILPIEAISIDTREELRRSLFNTN